MNARSLEPIIAFDETLSDRIRERLARRRNVEEKRMFGGIGFLLNGNMLVGVWKDPLIVRVGTDDYETSLREPSVSKFDITGSPMKGWVLVEPEDIVRSSTVTPLQPRFRTVSKRELNRHCPSHQAKRRKDPLWRLPIPP